MLRVKRRLSWGIELALVVFLVGVAYELVTELARERGPRTPSFECLIWRDLLHPNISHHTVMTESGDENLRVRRGQTDSNPKPRLVRGESRRYSWNQSVIPS